MKFSVLFLPSSEPSKIIDSASISNKTSYSFNAEAGKYYVLILCVNSSRDPSKSTFTGATSIFYGKQMMAIGNDWWTSAIHHVILATEDSVTITFGYTPGTGQNNRASTIVILEF